MLYIKRKILLVGLWFIFVIALLASGCATQNTAVQAPSGEVEKSNTPTPSASGSNIKTEKTVLTLYFASQDGRYLVPEKREIAKTDQPVRAALEELIIGPKDSGLVKTVSPTTKIRDIKIKNHTAYVDFSQAFVREHGGGSANEIITIYSVANTVTEFPDIQQVLFLVEGKALGTLSGHLDLTDPVLRNDAIIKK